MNVRNARVGVFAGTLLAVAGCAAAGRDAVGIDWTELAALPDPIGLAAPFAGVSEGQLIVAGGANFPDGRPWAGARKVWHDRVFLLDAPGGQWREVARLPAPLGYGVSVTIPQGVLCLGGSNDREHVRRAFVIRVANGTVRFEEFPSLPRPLANAAGARVGSVVYVAGGIERPDAAPGRQLWAFDLAATGDARIWRELEPCPGRPRMLPVAGELDGSFYLFGGTDLVPAGGGLTREYLRDAWRYTPGKGWFRLAHMPDARVAAPSPAPVINGRLLVLGGDDGELAPRMNELRDRHPGFDADILAYDPVANSWSTVGSVPKNPGPDPVQNPNAGVWPPVTTTVVPRRGGFVVPTGEIRPAVRTPRVLMARPAAGTGSRR